MTDYSDKKKEDNTTEDFQINTEEFIIEKIQTKRKQKWLKRLGMFVFLIVGAVVFGVVARLAFILSGQPLSDAIVKREEEIRGQVGVLSRTTPVPKASEVPNCTVTPILKPTPAVIEKTENTETVTPAPTGSEAPDYTPTPAVTNAPEQIPDDNNEHIQPVYDYEHFMAEIREAAQKVSSVVVSVDAITSKTDWNGTYEVRKSTSGLVLANDGVGILILTDYPSVENCSFIEITFPGYENKIYNASVYSYDKEYGLAILDVNVKDIEPYLYGQMDYAVVCSDELIEKGTPVFALGSPNGIKNSMEFGIVSSVGNMISVTDGELCMFTTDWIDYSNANGFVFDMTGYVCGMISHVNKSMNDTGTPVNCITLYSVKDEIDRLLNGGSLIYLGIRGVEIPESIKESSGIDNGIYVTEVIANSPAYLAGLKSGDVIRKINGVSIYSVADYMDVLAIAKEAEALNLEFARYYAEGTRELNAYVIITGRQLVH